MVGRQIASSSHLGALELHVAKVEPEHDTGLPRIELDGRLPLVLAVSSNGGARERRSQAAGQADCHTGGSHCECGLHARGLAAGWHTLFRSVVCVGPRQVRRRGGARTQREQVEPTAPGLTAHGGGGQGARRLRVGLNYVTDSLVVRPSYPAETT